MEKKEITQQMKEQLLKPLPKEAIKPHPTKSYLSSIKAIYVTERLSDVFGIGAWQISPKMIERGENGVVVVEVKLTIPEYGVELTSYGGNDNGGEKSKNFDLGDAYKGAVTDAITKIGSWLGIGIDVFKGFGDKAPAKPIPPKKPTFPTKEQDAKKFMEIVKLLTAGTYEGKDKQQKPFTMATLEEKYTVTEQVKKALIDEAINMQ